MAKKKKKVRLETPASNEFLKATEKFEGLGFLSDEEQLYIVPTIFPSFNRASLIGGFPGGSIIEFHGPEQGGKTTLGVGCLVSAQRAGWTTVICDGEGSFKDKVWPKSLLLDLDQTMYFSPLTYEEGADRVNEIVMWHLKKQRSKAKYSDVGLLILVDSLTSMTPRDELEGNVGKQNFGLQAKLTSQWLKMLNSLLKTTNISVIFVNQERVNIGASKFQKKWASAGGKALQFYAHFRVRVLQSSKVKYQDRVVGRQHKFIIEKNKISACDEIGLFYTSNGKGNVPLGWDEARTYFQEAYFLGIIEKQDKKYFCDFDEETSEGLMEGKFLKYMRDGAVLDKKIRKWFDRRFQRSA